MSALQNDQVLMVNYLKMKNELDDDTETPEAITSEEEKSEGRRLGLREFVVTLIIIVVVWALQKCFST